MKTFDDDDIDILLDYKSQEAQRAETIEGFLHIAAFITIGFIVGLSIGVIMRWAISCGFMT